MGRYRTRMEALTLTATTNAAPSAAAPTKAEFDAVVTLANELKNDLNAIVTALKA